MHYGLYFYILRSWMSVMCIRALSLIYIGVVFIYSKVWNVTDGYWGVIIDMHRGLYFSIVRCRTLLMSIGGNILIF